MADATSAPSDKPKQLIATLLLERPAAPDYRLLAERIGKPLDFDLVRKFGSYIIAKGPVVKDGDTMGLTETQRIKVRFVRSFRPDVNDNVYWLELAEQQSVQRPTGFFSKLFGSDRKQ
jgi:hypothetical protein